MYRPACGPRGGEPHRVRAGGPDGPRGVPVSEARRRTVLLGASGWIGQHFARLLDDHPYFDSPILTGATSAGKSLGELWQLADQPVPQGLAESKIERLTPAEIARRGVEVAFSALPSGEAGAFEAELARRGVAVFSNASAHRMDPQVPLVIPEINGDHLDAIERQPWEGSIVTNSNCSTAGLVLALAPLVPLLRPKEVFVATYQALSGAGYPGVPSLSIEDNVLPFIAEEEEKMERETAKILGGFRGGRFRPLSLPVSAHCARVGSREGHLEAVTLKAGTPAKASEIVRAWEDFQPLSPRARGDRETLPTAPDHPVVYRREVDRPQPIRDRWAGTPARARGMAVSVGRLRVDREHVRFFTLSHNAVRGGAGGSVLNAELALRKGLLGGRRR
ncbi:MAG: aspartate-semialdehyde dehydrogenase [Euryarchaeota archaeon]|nr:aspartate-semialdehyde dehydrogenase [Euryarchaeota archaeon]MDE1837108.1 aspartate-semialdehyde dehydrogenase [Euryarchaeota archaeon]MDE1879680.1 aspartate-semialdehyde dehydrogenase [Euryarchaeota archaeon]MDE2045206.1 aspartate-semialdehyde dehydrogenase [Thermoplasmata archaeon]